MDRFYGLLWMILLSAEAKSNENSVVQRNRALAKTNVVSLAFCGSDLSAEAKVGKK